MLRVWRDAVRATHAFLADADAAFYKAMVRDDVLPGHAATVATDANGTVVGWSVVVGDDLACLFVDPTRHRMGIGRRLVEASGATTLDVNEQNAGARAFYERLGFDVVGRSDRDGTGRPYPLLHLRRPADAKKNPAGS